MLNAIAEIESFFADRPMQFANYLADLRTKRAVEGNLEIVGEAMNRIVKKNSVIQISNSKKIVDIRNRIIHGYDTVSDEVIWGILVRHLPVLRSETENLLSE